jgi:hypothetical protein
MPLRLRKIPAEKQRFTTLALVGIFLYDLFCVSDLLMLPDIYQSAWKIRLGIVTPLMFLFLGCLRLKRFERSMDYIIGFGMTIASMSIMVIWNMKREETTC